MQESISLFELNELIRQSIEHCLPDEYWIEAELSEVHLNGGHCYVEFVQNNERNNRCVAKARGIIWQSVFCMLRPYFEETTGQRFVAGIKVKVLVKINFHEVYGYSLTVLQIDPAYTMGDMALKRQKILKQLEEEGIINLNKELFLSELPQHIAVISSKTAAGYGDFCNQLYHNEQGFAFQIDLYEAVMQGNQTEVSVLEALQKIDARYDDYDVLVIIRGGGSTSDLSSFDNYLLAASVAQFRIPVITGIGHERDETVLDRVAHTRVKTPTAAATLLIDRVAESVERLWNLADDIRKKTTDMLKEERQRIQLLQAQIPALAAGHINHCKMNIQDDVNKLQTASGKYLEQEKHRLETLSSELKVGSEKMMEKHRHKLDIIQSKISDASPDNILAKGYSITLCGGKVVKDAATLSKGETIETRLFKGALHAVIDNIH